MGRELLTSFGLSNLAFVFLDFLFDKRFTRTHIAERLEKLELPRQGLIQYEPFALRAEYQALELFQLKLELLQLYALFSLQAPQLHILGDKLFARVFVVRRIHLYKVRLKALLMSAVSAIFIHKTLAFSVEKLALDLDFFRWLWQVKTPPPLHGTQGYPFQDEHQFFPLQAAGCLPGVFSRW